MKLSLETYSCAVSLNKKCWVQLLMWEKLVLSINKVNIRSGFMEASSIFLNPYQVSMWMLVVLLETTNLNNLHFVWSVDERNGVPIGPRVKISSFILCVCHLIPTLFVSWTKDLFNLFFHTVLVKCDAGMKQYISLVVRYRYYFARWF